MICLLLLSVRYHSSSDPDATLFGIAAAISVFAVYGLFRLVGSSEPKRSDLTFVQPGDVERRESPEDEARRIQSEQPYRHNAVAPFVSTPYHPATEDRNEFHRPEQGVWKFRVAGGSHASRVGGVDRMSILKALQEGQKLEFVREPTNEFDFNAICIYLLHEDAPSIDIGFVPKGYAATLAPLMDRQAEFEWSGEIVRQGPKDYYAYLYVRATMVAEPKLKHRPARATILRRYQKELESAAGESTKVVGA